MEQITPENQVTYVGVDIAKDRLDYTVDDTCCAHVENTHRGHRALIKHLQSLPNARVVCEATGGYERAIVAALLLAQIQVCVVNPGRVRAFARAAGLLAKTDQLDAKLLRRFGLQMKPRLHRALDEAAATLRELLDYRRQISDQLVATGNRCELAGRILCEPLEILRALLATELEQTDALIKTHIHEDDSLRTKARSTARTPRRRTRARGHPARLRA
ncbi:MAG: transposase [Candidatus Synoicihabitans palmerolidicus]|nr:transposase [Candidatus Synoicihabitans palmerolidicus]